MRAHTFFAPEQGLEFVFRTYSVASAFLPGLGGGGASFIWP